MPLLDDFTITHNRDASDAALAGPKLGRFKLPVDNYFLQAMPAHTRSGSLVMCSYEEYKKKREHATEAIIEKQI